MAEFTRMEVINKMMETGLIPLFYHNDINVSKKLVKALYLGGARVIEFTARGNFSFQTFSQLSQYVASNYSDLILGVGSITDAAAASLYMQAGAQFIVTPVLREDIAIVCNRRKVLWSPGCTTITEIAKAEELGCEMIKFFPASSFGSDFIKAVKGPQPWTTFMATGGIKPEEADLKEWFEAGVSCVGIGSQLIVKNPQGLPEYSEIQILTEKVIKTIKKYKSGK